MFQKQYFIKNKNLIGIDIFGNEHILIKNFKLQKNFYNQNIQKKNITEINIQNQKKIYSFLKAGFKNFPQKCWYLFKINNILYLVATTIDNNICILNKSEQKTISQQILEIYSQIKLDLNYNYEIIECESNVNQGNILIFENNKFIGCQNGIIKL